MTTDGPRDGGSRDGARAERREGYLDLSRGAWHTLLFVLPLVAIFEIGSALYLGEIHQTVAAFRLIARAYQTLGAVGVHLPALALICVLLAQHVFSHKSWRIRWSVPAAMVIESAVWTAPLTIVAILLASGPAAGGGGAGELASASWQARLTIAVGAGLYEELVFRMLAIALVHFLARDLAGMREGVSLVVALLASTVAFTLYHDLRGPGGGIDLPRMAFLVIGGLYFGSLYLSRGFGIAVGVHALYDVLALLVIGKI